MTCKDCLHYEACNHVFRSFGDEISKAASEKDGVERNCATFADKTLYVKLPCKVGDEIYRIVKPSGVCKPFVPTLPDKVEPFGICYRNVMGGYSLIPFDKIGKTVFLSRAEAEAALKEREACSE